MSANDVEMGTPKDRLSLEALEALSARLEDMTPADIVLWAHSQYGSGLALASSFGAEDMVLVDLLCRIAPHPHIFYLDTGLLFPQTYQLIEQVAQRYRIQPVRVAGEWSVSEPATSDGEALWKKNPDACCHLRKVQPLTFHLAGKDAWMTGIRRDQTPFRRQAPIVSFDNKYGLVKINPLANWSSRDVFRYLVKNQVPYNPLHDQGYPSIGCVPCTQKVMAGEGERAGRWAGQEKIECGLHL